MKNVFWYKQTGDVVSVPNQSEGLELSFVAVVAPAIQAIQSDSVRWEQILVENVDDLTDFYVIDFAFGSVTGEVSGQVMPPFVSYAFRLLRATRAVRNGAKRIGGVPEAYVTDGEIDGSAVSLVNDCADALGESTAEPDLGTWEPIIMRVEIVHIPDIGYIYTDFPMNGAQFISISSQNTRKFGRGE